MTTQSSRSQRHYNFQAKRKGQDLEKSQPREAAGFQLKAHPGEKAGMGGWDGHKGPETEKTLGQVV